MLTPQAYQVISSVVDTEIGKLRLKILDLNSDNEAILIVTIDKTIANMSSHLTAEIVLALNKIQCESRQP